MFDHRPDYARFFYEGLRTFRTRLEQTGTENSNPVQLTITSFQHLPMYILYGWETGIYNEFRHLQSRGLSKAQLMELVMYAQLQAGMRGLQLVYNAVGKYLPDWRDGPGEVPLPEGWAADPDAFKAGREIFHVDVDAGEMNNRVTGVRPILADLKRFADAALPAVKAASLPDRPAWIDEIRDLRSEWPDTEETRDATGINPNVLMHELSAVAGDAAIYVADVGQHQMWAAQSLELNSGQRFLTSGGLGSMGFGLPAAMGAAARGQARPRALSI